MPFKDQPKDTPPTPVPVTDDAEAKLEAARAELLEVDKARSNATAAQFEFLNAGDRSGATVEKSKIDNCNNRLQELLLQIGGPVNGAEKGLEIRAARAKYKRLTADLNAAILRRAEVGKEIIAQRDVVKAKEAELKDENKKLAALNAKKTGVYEASRDLKAHQALYSDLNFTGGN